MQFIGGRRRSAMVALIAAGGLSGAGIAVAGNDDNGPRTDDVTMQFTGAEDLESRNETNCEGQDGTYRKLRQVYTGEAVGGTDRDPTNLTGRFTAHVHSFINLPTFEGTTRGTFMVREPGTNRKKFEGTFIGATGPTGVEGILVGHVIDIDPTTPPSAGRLVGTFRVGVVPDVPQRPNPFIVEGDVGANDELPANEPAVVQVGSCGHDGQDDGVD